MDGVACLSGRAALSNGLGFMGLTISSPENLEKSRGDDYCFGSALVLQSPAVSVGVMVPLPVTL